MMRQYNRNNQKNILNIELSHMVKNNNTQKIMELKKQVINLFLNEFNFDIVEFKPLNTMGKKHDDDCIYDIGDIISRTPTYNIITPRNRNIDDSFEQKLMKMKFDMKSVNHLIDMAFNEKISQKNLFQLIEIDAKTKTIAFTKNAIKTYYLKKQVINSINEKYRIEKSVIKSIFNEITNFNKYSDIFIDINTYFETVSNILPIHKYDVGILRIEEITNECWGILPIRVFAKLLKKVGKKNLLRVYTQIINWLRKTNLGKSLLNTHDYYHGIHIGELLLDLVHNGMHTEVRHPENLRIYLISKALWKLFLGQRAKNMTLSSRYYKVLKKLDYYSLVKTLLDENNIVTINNNIILNDDRNIEVLIHHKNGYCNLNYNVKTSDKFVLNKIVKGNTPLTKTSRFVDNRDVYKNNFNWLETFGIIPKNPLLKKIDKNIVIAIHKTNTFKYVLRAMKKYDIKQEHDMIALVKIALIWKDSFPKLSLEQLHDFGINLPVIGVSTEKNMVEFIKKNWSIDKQQIILFAVNNEETCIKNGINIHKNTCLSKLEKLFDSYCISNMQYDSESIRNIELAQICAYNNVDTHDFEKIQDRFSLAIQNLSSELLIPNEKIFSDSGNIYIQRMSKTNPKGLFIGLYTSCCQYPSGAGDSCAWHSIESEISSLYVIYNSHTDAIIGQSWFWVDQEKNTAVFDNIEVKHNINVNLDDIENIYKKLSIELRDTYRYKNVYIGIRYDDSKISSKYNEFYNDCHIQNYNGYSDAREVISLI